MEGGDWTKMDSVIGPFEKLHPNIKVVYQPVAIGDMTTKIQSSVGQGQTTPDIYWVDQPRVPGYAARGLLLDLTGRFPDVTTQVFGDALQQSSSNGHLYALPFAESTGVVVYNKDLLTKAGVTLPTSDPANRWTWEQVAAAAAKAQGAGAKYGILWDQVEMYYQLSVLPESLGSTGLTGADNLTPDITNSAWTTAMTWFQNLFTSKVSPVGVSDADTYDLFSSGQSAFLVTGPWVPALVSNHKINMGLMAEPYFAAGKPVTPSGSWAIGINPHTPNLDAALLFLQYTTLDPAGNLALDLAEGDASSLNSNIALLYQTPPYDWWAETPQIPTLMSYELKNTAVTRPRSIGYPEFEAVMTQAFTDIRTGSDVATVLQRATTQLQAAFAALQ
jgi:multiple sugar transport system substrate-binding protein